VFWLSFTPQKTKRQPKHYTENKKTAKTLHRKQKDSQNTTQKTEKTAKTLHRKKKKTAKTLHRKLVFCVVFWLSFCFLCSAWQQTIAIHPNNNRGTETQQSATDFDANGNLLGLNNIGNLEWHYNNTLNKLIQTDKTNATEYCLLPSTTIGLV
jgi:uncharacterized Rmd1/YagE family protein